MKKIVAFVILAGTIVACKKPVEPAKEYVKLEVQPVYGTSNLYLDSTYLSPEGYAFKVTDFRFYLTDFINGTDTLFDVALYDYRETGTQLARVEGDKSKFGNFTAKIGVPATKNHLDPSTFLNSSPLNISNAGQMHWSWNTGYIFFSIEGKVDTLNTGNFDLNFSYHIGSDNMLRELNLTNLNWTKSADHEHKATLKFDFLNFISNPNRSIDLKTEYLTHTAFGQEQLTNKVVESFKESFKAN